MSKYLSHRLPSPDRPQAQEAAIPPGCIRLDTGGSPFPPSPLVVTQLAEYDPRQLNSYPDPQASSLRIKMAARERIQPENVLPVNGADEALTLALLAFCDEMTGAVMPELSYGFYRAQAELFGVYCRELPLHDGFTIDPADYFQQGNTIFLANPNPPGGAALSGGEIESIVRRNPTNMVVVDETYVYFGCPSCAPLIKKYANLLVVRSLSISRSLAGLRVGFALGNAALIADLEQVRAAFNPYGLNQLAQAAAAAALDDDSYYLARCSKTAATREMTARFLRQRGFAVCASQASFLLTRHPRLTGRQLQQLLLEQGVLVRCYDLPPLDDYIRVTVGSTVQMVRLIEALTAVTQQFAP